MKIRPFIYLICILCLATACDDFLTIVPKGKVIPSSLEENRALLLNAYNKFPSDRGLTAFRSDESSFNTTSSEDVESYGDIFTWNDESPSDLSLKFKWLEYYEVIFICNRLIDYCDQIEDATEDERNQLKGEAYVMRAYAYHTLANLYATPVNKSNSDALGVPLNLDNDMQAVLPRAPLSEVNSQIEDDIASGIALMNVESQATEQIYLWSKEAALAFLIRHHLYAEEWEDVMSTATSLLQITNRQLADMVADADVVPNDYNSPEVFVSVEVPLSSDHQRAIFVSDTLIARYNRYDKRLTRYYKAETLTKQTVRKGGSTQYRCSFRLAEVYLSVAEALAHTSSPELAADTLLALAEKRLSSSQYTRYATEVNAMTTEELINEIAEERFRELAFEGHRWFDLRRTSQASITHILNDITYSLGENDSRYTIIIPQEAREANPLLNN